MPYGRKWGKGGVYNFSLSSTPPPRNGCHDIQERGWGLLFQEGETPRGWFSGGGRAGEGRMGSQHPSPNVKTFCTFRPQNWLEIITSRAVTKMLLLKAPRHDHFWRFFGGNFSAKRDCITWWMRPAEGSARSVVWMEERGALQAHLNPQRVEHGSEGQQCMAIEVEESVSPSRTHLCV